MRQLVLIAVMLFAGIHLSACNEAAESGDSVAGAPTAKASCEGYCEATAACTCDVSAGCDNGNLDRCILIKHFRARDIEIRCCFALFSFIGS